MVNVPGARIVGLVGGTDVTAGVAPIPGGIAFVARDLGVEAPTSWQLHEVTVIRRLVEESMLCRHSIARQTTIPKAKYDETRMYWYSRTTIR